MALENHTDSVTKEIRLLYETNGNEDYDGEPVSQLSHMIQCAMQAIREGADNELVLGAFLHDVGHLLHNQQQTESMGNFGVVDHERIGAEYLKAKGFSERICALVYNHVNAKRFLVATDPLYKAKLSIASNETLKWQGGPMNEEEIKKFRQHPFMEEIIRVRLWDEQAKHVDASLLPLEHFEEMIRKYLNARSGKSVLAG